MSRVPPEVRPQISLRVPLHSFVISNPTEADIRRISK